MTEIQAADVTCRQTDAELLARMAEASTSPRCAQAAWEQFYLRHAAYLYAACLRGYGPLIGQAGAADLVSETFLRAYHGAGRYRDGGLSDADALRRRTRAWLGRIAQRLCQDMLRGRGAPRACQISDDHWRQIGEIPPDRPGPGDAPPVSNVRAARLAAMAEAVASLTEREQVVLRATLQWRADGDDRQRMSRRACSELADALGTTPENLRQIRRRAMKKIEAIVRAKFNEPRKEAQRP